MSDKQIGSVELDEAHVCISLEGATTAQACELRVQLRDLERSEMIFDFGEEDGRLWFYITGDSIAALEQKIEEVEAITKAAAAAALVSAEELHEEMEARARYMERMTT